MEDCDHLSAGTHCDLLMRAYARREPRLPAEASGRATRNP